MLPKHRKHDEVIGETSETLWRKPVETSIELIRKQFEKQNYILFNENPMLLVLNKILSMKFGNDFLEKKNDLVLIFFVYIILLQQQQQTTLSQLFGVGYTNPNYKIPCIKTILFESFLLVGPTNNKWFVYCSICHDSLLLGLLLGSKL